MKIETEFNIGDSFWVMRDNKPKVFHIESIRTLSEKSSLDHYQTVSNTSVFYKVYGETTTYLEDDIFRTKADLLNSL